MPPTFRWPITGATSSRTWLIAIIPIWWRWRATVDVLLVITPGGAGTKYLINAQVLEALGPNGILINVARGSVVDEAALIEALQKKKIYAAGLDVFANEPHVPQALIDMEQVVLLPHVGSASVLYAARDGPVGGR